MTFFEDLTFNYRDDVSRLTHIEGVVTWSMRLARHLALDEKAMKIAAYLHDFTKPLPDSWHLDVFKKYHVRLPEDFPAFAYHGVSAATVGTHEYGIENPDILNAVFYHTTGRPKMNTFEKVLMFADKTEPSRPYPEADALRKSAMEDFDNAFIKMLELLREYDLSLKRPITQSTAKTYQYYLRPQEAL